jgi:hypothetical protein
MMVCVESFQYIRFKIKLLSFIFFYPNIEEVGEFNREFEDKITSQMRYNNQHHHSNTRSHHHLNNNHPLAIDDGSHSRR